MKLLRCSKCNDDCKARRMTHINKEGITELYDIIYHKDGSKEKRIWATLKEQKILSAKFI